MEHADLPDELNDLTGEIVDSAYGVHRALGPGLLEGTYVECLIRELEARDVPFEKEKTLQIEYRDALLETKLRADLLVDERVVVEIKSVENVLPVHQAQVLSYMRASGARVGLLLNFNVTRKKDGIDRFIS